VVDIKGRDIVVFHVNGGFFALLDRCPHQGAPLDKAACVARLTSPEPGVYRRSRVDELLRCPWHGWEFDMRNDSLGSTRSGSRCAPIRSRSRAARSLQRRSYGAGGGGYGTFIVYTN
jgi:nitrite reductase/ring-hydroxylating ferredoxin subunit